MQPSKAQKIEAAIASSGEPARHAYLREVVPGHGIYAHGLRQRPADMPAGEHVEVKVYRDAKRSDRRAGIAEMQQIAVAEQQVVDTALSTLGYLALPEGVQPVGEVDQTAPVLKPFATESHYDQATGRVATVVHYQDLNPVK